MYSHIKNMLHCVDKCSPNGTNSVSKNIFHLNMPKGFSICDFFGACSL